MRGTLLMKPCAPAQRQRRSAASRSSSSVRLFFSSSPLPLAGSILGTQSPWFHPIKKNPFSPLSIYTCTRHHVLYNKKKETDPWIRLTRNKMNIKWFFTLEKMMPSNTFGGHPRSFSFYFPKTKIDVTANCRNEFNILSNSTKIFVVVNVSSPHRNELELSCCCWDLNHVREQLLDVEQTSVCRMKIRRRQLFFSFSSS